MEQRLRLVKPPTEIPRRTALRFVVLLGVVSLFADMTYEGARSITGPYLAMLGASGAAVGFISGFGELIGYGLRLASGFIADRTGRYWAVTLTGYFLNLLAVPPLAFTGRWELAAALMIGERMGKAVRTPARDAMLSHATKELGHGFGFGLHEAMDQAGAMLGPLGVAAVLYFQGGYRLGFGILLLPALCALGVLFAARWLYPRPRDLEASPPAPGANGFPSSYWLYVAAGGLIAAGYADYPLIAYHFGKVSSVPAGWIPIFYAIAMGVAALAALCFGYLFDRIGLAILIVSAVLSSLVAPLAFLGGFTPALLGMALWGMGTGVQESILRAAIAGMIPADQRGTAYGLFNTGFGICWFLGSALMGLLYDRSVGWLVTFSIIAQLAAIPLFVAVINTRRSQARL
jgi:MFS family permease